MATNNSKYHLRNKHAQIKQAHLRRCETELNDGNYYNANLVVENFLWLYPDDYDDIQELKALFISMGNKLFEQKNQDEIHNFITPLIKNAPFITDTFEKDIISSLSIDLEEHYTSLAFKYFFDAQFQSALSFCSFVLLLNMDNKNAKVLNYMIHRLIFMEYQKTSGNYALSESFYLAIEGNLIFVTLLNDLVRDGILLFLDKIVGRCELERKNFYFSNVEIKDKPPVKIGYLIKQEDISVVITRLNEGYLFNIFYSAGSRVPQIRLEDFRGNDITDLIKSMEISSEEYEKMGVA